MSLKAIVIGCGWAGEGHTLALRDASVDVVAICGRTCEVARAVAEKLRIPNVRFDWRSVLAEFSPNIVAIATPAAPHHEMAVAAAEAGCHVACEKPLAGKANEAKAMLEAVENAGVKHAYASTSSYGRCFIHARSLLAGGLIGDIFQIEQSCHVALSHCYLTLGCVDSAMVGACLTMDCPIYWASFGRSRHVRIAHVQEVMIAW